jgi:hypothetical protein
MASVSGILAAAHAMEGVDLDLSMAGLMDMGSGIKSLGMGKLGAGMKGIKSGRGVMKGMAGSAKMQKMSGPMAKMKKEMDRHVNLDGLKDKAEAKIAQAKEKANEAKEKAMSAANEAREKAQKFAEDKLEEAKKFAEDKMDAMMEAMDDDEGETLLKLSPEEIAQQKQAAKKAASCNLFKIDNRFRIFAMKMVDDPKFEKVVLFFIFLSSVIMAAEGPPNAAYLRDEPAIRYMFHVANVLLLFVFWLEMICKIVADGFLKTPAAYLNSGWNRMDFVVVITATVDFLMSTFASEASFQYVRSARVLRILRPLRMMKANESMSTLIEALTKCVPVLFGAFSLSIIFYLVFAIFGMSLFMGKFYSCNCDGEFNLPIRNCTNTDYAVLDRDPCLAQGGTWENPP